MNIVSSILYSILIEENTSFFILLCNSFPKELG
nr:MAG TPA: hypothetical protein [Caudoviricetes sp.]